MIDKTNKNEKVNLNQDAITGEIGAHPVGTGIGAASGAGTAAIAGGVLAGPAGAIAGAVFGAVAGGLAGKEVAEAANPTIADIYWSTNYSSRPYIKKGANYEYYRPAYNFGYEQRVANSNKKFDETEQLFRTKWDSSKNVKKLEWNEAREAVRESYELGDGFYDIGGNTQIKVRKGGDTKF